MDSPSATPQHAVRTNTDGQSMCDLSSTSQTTDADGLRAVALPPLDVLLRRPAHIDSTRADIQMSPTDPPTRAVNPQTDPAHVETGTRAEEAPVFDFLLGLDSLRRYQCNVDLAKNVLRISTSGGADRAGGRGGEEGGTREEGSEKGGEGGGGGDSFLEVPFIEF